MLGSDPVAAALRLRPWLTTMCLILALALVTERAGYAGLYSGPSEGLAGRLLVQLLLALPAVLYLAALWQLRRAVAAVAAGSPFGPAIVSALRRSGALLVGGATATLFIQPSLHRLLDQAWPRLIDFDVATLVLAGIGVALVFLARLVERAAGVEAELDAIF